MATNGFQVVQSITGRYSLNLWETIRSKDKEPYDNTLGGRF
uniref:Uncharacterized protein n=1 Tax=viral metagenome TaxID=1070528 RepID=A0A6C0AMW7_9ZZZZ